MISPKCPIDLHALDITSSDSVCTQHVLLTAMDMEHVILLTVCVSVIMDGQVILVPQVRGCFKVIRRQRFRGCIRDSINQLH